MAEFPARRPASVARRRHGFHRSGPRPAGVHRERSLATLAAVVMMLLVVYASLFPFEGWRWPAGSTVVQALDLPWPRWRDHADEWLNRLGYVPVGLLVTVAFLRVGRGLGASLLLGIAVPSVLSYAMEVTQHLLPARVPSLRDWLGNATGAVAGAVLAIVLQLTGWLDRWRIMRDRWFTRDSATALILLMLWPAALLVPAPLPFTLGQCWQEIRAWMVPLIGSLPLSALGLEFVVAAPKTLPLGAAPITEIGAIALSVVSPLALACAAGLPGVRRGYVLLGLAGIGLLGMMLSTAMNFGPAHAWAWFTPATAVALALAFLMALLLLLPSGRLCAVLGLLATATAVILAAQVQPDAYHAASLQAWEQGRFIRFSGLAQWVGWLWPYAAMGWLVLHLMRDPDSLQFGRR